MPSTMQRSTSKLLSRASSLRNINKTGYVFRFDLEPESLDKLSTTAPVVLAWHRGSKSTCATAPVRVDKARVAAFAGQKLSQEVTLFKKRKGGLEFEERVHKLAVRADSANGKALARIELNFADYAGVPSFTKRVAAVMSNGGRLVMRVSSNFVGEAKKKKKKTVCMMEPGSDTGSVTGSVSEASADGPAAPDGKRDSLDGLIDGLEVDGAAKSPGKSLVTDGVKSVGKPLATHDTKAPPDLKQDADAPVKGAMDVKPAADGGIPFASFTSFQKDKDWLKDTERKSGISQESATVDRETIERLSSENESLRKSLAELQAKIAREPVYKDLVRELRETKMALAILTLEKDEIMKEMREMKDAASQTEF